MPITLGQMQVYTLAELAQRLEVSETAIRRLISEKKLAARRIGRQWFVADRALADFFSRTDDLQLPAADEPETDLDALISTLK